MHTHTDPVEVDGSAAARLGQPLTPRRPTPADQVAGWPDPIESTHPEGLE